MGGGSSSSLFPTTGTGTASGAVTGELASNTLFLKGGRFQIGSSALQSHPSYLFEVTGSSTAEYLYIDTATSKKEYIGSVFNGLATGLTITNSLSYTSATLTAAYSGPTPMGLSINGNTKTFSITAPNGTSVSDSLYVGGHGRFNSWVSMNDSLYVNGKTTFNNTTSATTINATTVNATTLTATAGAGFQNMEVKTSGTSASWSVPAALQVTGAKWKVTIVGGGGQGGGTNTTAGQTGAGGGSGGVVVCFITYVAGQNTMTYTVGAGGSTGGTNANGQGGGNSSIVYNSVTITAGGGGGGNVGSSAATGGTGGTASGGTLNIAGGTGGSSGTMASTSNYQGDGASTPLGYGQGGKMPSTAAGSTGQGATGFGAGGSGGRNGTGTTARAGGAGTAGVVIIEY